MGPLPSLLSPSSGWGEGVREALGWVSGRSCAIYMVCRLCEPLPSIRVLDQSGQLGRAMI